MIKRTTTLASILVTTLALTFAAAGSAFAGEGGKSCGDKKKPDTAAVSFPVKPLA